MFLNMVYYYVSQNKDQLLVQEEPIAEGTQVLVEVERLLQHASYQKSDQGVQKIILDRENRWDNKWSHKHKKTSPQEKI